MVEVYELEETLSIWYGIVRVAEASKVLGGWIVLEYCDVTGGKEGKKLVLIKKQKQEL